MGKKTYKRLVIRILKEMGIYHSTIRNFNREISLPYARRLNFHQRRYSLEVKTFDDYLDILWDLKYFSRVLNYAFFWEATLERHNVWEKRNATFESIMRTIINKKKYFLTFLNTIYLEIWKITHIFAAENLINNK